MKHTVIAILFMIVFFGKDAQAQLNTPDTKPAYFVGNISISYDKTTMLLFPYAIRPGDVGSSAVIAQKIKGVDNAVKLKAAQRNFVPTNVNIFTADGKLYSLNVIYSDTVKQTVYDFGEAFHDVAKPDNPTSLAILSDETMHEDVLDTCLQTITSRHSFLRHPRSKNELIRAAVTGLFYKNGAMFIKVRLRNTGYIPYTVDFTRSTIESIGKTKRKAQNQEEITPFFNYHLSDTVDEHKSTDIVLVYKRFTIPKDRKLVVHLYEKDGHRNLVFSMKARLFRKTKTL